MNSIPLLDKVTSKLQEIPNSPQAPGPSVNETFTNALKQAVNDVEGLQKNSEAAQQALIEGQPVELHDVLIRIEEAEIAFKTMMEIRNKLVNSYHEIMRMGGGG